MKTRFFSIITTMLLFSMHSSAEENFIPKNFLDLDQVRMEEQLSPDSRLLRVYIFLAVLNPSTKSYDMYVTKGKNDLDQDGQTALEEPNDLHEYKNVAMDFGKEFSIMEQEYVCYINDLPEFEELFPDQDNPFENNDTLLGVSTRVTDEDEKLLTGSKTLPTMNEDGSAVIVERYSAFYHKYTQKDKDDKNDENKITSYGFIALQFQDATG